jgi:hypothetical protein
MGRVGEVLTASEECSSRISVALHQEVTFKVAGYYLKRINANPLVALTKGGIMFSIQWYEVDNQRKIGTPEGVFYTEQKAREVAQDEELQRSFQDFPPRHFVVVPA